MKKILLPLLFSVSTILSYSQNVGVSTDGSLPETGVMLDVKIPTDKATTAAVATFFQIKSMNTSGNELKFRFGLKTDATQANRYGFIDFPDFTAGTPTYLNLSLQPNGGNLGIGTTAPSFDVELSKNVNTGVNMVSHNTSTGTAAAAFSYVLNDANKWVTLGVNGSGFSSTSFGITGANQSQVVSNTPLVIGTANNNHTYFGTNNTIRGIVDGATGYFGMGTVTPVEELQVNGNIAIGKDLANNATASTYTFYTPVNSLTSNIAPIGNTLQIEAGHLTSTIIPITNVATAGSLILKAGNVGDLGQNGTTATTFTAGNVDVYGGYSVTGIVAGSTTRVPGSVRFFTSTNSAANDVTFTERMRVHYNGNVGIGTSAPSSLLEVKGAGGVDMLRVVSNSGRASLVLTSAVGNTSGPIISWSKQNVAEFAMYTYNGAAKLAIVDAATGNDAFSIMGGKTTVGNGSGISGNSSLNVYGNAAVGLTYYNTAAPANGMIIEGNVGIGSTNPTSKLQVVGLPVYVNNAAALAGGLTVGAFYRTGADPDPVCVVH